MDKDSSHSQTGSRENQRPHFTALMGILTDTQITLQPGQIQLAPQTKKKSATDREEELNFIGSQQKLPPYVFHHHICTLQAASLVCLVS